jgi:hypothetical protein
LLAVVGTGSRRFVDVGAGDGVHMCNCANLAFNLGFEGLFIDADAVRIASGTDLYAHHRDTRAMRPRLVHAFVTTSSINAIISDAGFQGDVDVLSIDIDGNDYWIWEAIDCIKPRIVVIETHDEYGFDDVLAPYQENFVWGRAEPGAPFGASPVAMTKLADRLGYRLVGGNRRGFNAIYLRSDLAPAVPTIEVGELLSASRHRFAAARMAGYDLDVGSGGTAGGADP